jgi:hypothetical protein
MQCRHNTYSETPDLKIESAQEQVPGRDEFGLRDRLRNRRGEPKMTESVTAITSEKDSARAGAKLGREIREAFRGESADAVVVFASSVHDYSKLLEALSEAAGTATIVGSSSAGEFTNSSRGEGSISALALRSDTMEFSIGFGSNMAGDPVSAAREVASGFEGLKLQRMPYRAALVMTDALAGHTDAFLEELTVATRGNYRFFGGGAGDDGRFQKTHVFAGTSAHSDAAVALEMLSAYRTAGCQPARGCV